MSALNVALALAAGTVLALGLVSGYIKNRLWLSEALVATLLGIAIGPAMLDFATLELEAERQSAFLREAARVTLAISVMGAALRLPSAYEAQHWRELLVILGLGMPLMWLASSAVTFLVLGLPVLYACLVGAALAPTDPVLSDSIVTGKVADQAIPSRMRDALSAESGANDGLAILLVMLPVFLLEDAPERAVLSWLQQVLVYQVLVGVAVGLAAGWLAGRCLTWALRQPFSEQPSILTLAIALSLTVLAIDRLLGTAAILAVFVSGLAFNRVTAAREEASHEHMQTAVARFFDIPIFIFFGAVLPWSAWQDIGWIGILFALLALLLRRLPAWFLLHPLLNSARDARETVFNGWFGPIGIAAVYYATELQHKVERGDEVWALVSLVVFTSIILHGITATPLTRLYGQRSRGKLELH
jgi:NhaP-type Na+/H+ or K+/H+ antiporter